MRLSNTFVRRAAAVAFTVGVIAAATTGPAYAAAPTNDSYADRVVIGATPFSTEVDTSEATTDAIDADLNATCGAPATDASIWYEVTAASDGGLVVDLSGSSYSVGALVAVGGPGNWTIVGCAPVGVAWHTTAGTTYTVLVIDDQFDGVGNGGTARINVTAIPPAPSLDISVNPRAQFTRSGSAIVSGTAVCDPGAALGVETTLTQRFGRVILRGFTVVYLICDGTEQPWSAEIVANNGKFAGGKAASVTFAYACGSFECSVDYEERTVQLSRAS